MILRWKDREMGKSIGMHCISELIMDLNSTKSARSSHPESILTKVIASNGNKQQTK